MEAEARDTDDISSLRRTVRDLVALSTLPAVWSGYSANNIAHNLADVLLNTLSLDLIYIQVNDERGQDSIQVIRSKRPLAQERRSQIIEEILAPRLATDSPGQPISGPNADCSETMRFAVVHFEHGTQKSGVVAAANRDEFPTRSDRLLLGVGANQAAVMIQLKRAQNALGEADRRKDEFLAMLAHELRNPLAPIGNALQTMELAGDNREVTQEARHLIERQLQHMIRLVDDLLDISRVTLGRIPLRKEQVELAAVFQQAIETSRPVIESARHQLKVTLPPQRIWLDGDPTRVTQVFSNLLNNAAKYTKDGGQIWLTAEQEGEEVVVRVRDNGIGIPTEMLSRIFEMFTQVDGSLERSHGGLGIGLTLVKSLVEMHNGKIEARSDGPGQGSEFIVRLPTIPERLDIPATRNGEENQHSLSGRRILIVDDNVDSAKSLGMLLRLLGHDTVLAHDAPTALETALRYLPDVVLLDIGLPGMNGYDLARCMRRQPELHSVPLVALTGWGQEDARHRSHAAGFSYHLTKPVDRATLESLFRSL
jgi:signal transduction histidine kinase